MATGYHLRAKQKAPKPHTPLSGFVLAQALVSWDAGSCASICTLLMHPHRLHLKLTLRITDSGSTGISFPRPQTGQMTHPSLTALILPHFASCDNPAHSFLLQNQRKYTYPQGRKIQKSYELVRFLRLVLVRFRRGSRGSRYLIQANSPYPLTSGPNLANVSASGGAASVT